MTDTPGRKTVNAHTTPFLEDDLEGSVEPRDGTVFAAWRPVSYEAGHTTTVDAGRAASTTRSSSGGGPTAALPVNSSDRPRLTERESTRQEAQPFAASVPSRPREQDLRCANPALAE